MTQIRAARRPLLTVLAVLVAAAIMSTGCSSGASGVGAGTATSATESSATPGDGAATDAGGSADDQPEGAAEDPADDAAAGAAGTVYPLTVDNCGFQVAVDEAPQRVVAIKSTAIEMLLALGLSDRIVGTAFPDGPAAAQWAPSTDLPLLSEKVPGQEATLAVEPDFIYAGWESNLTADGVGDRSELAQLGIATFVAPAACQEAAYQPHPLTWETIFDEVGTVGDIFDVPEAADDLIESLKNRLSAIAPDERGLTALWYSSGTKAGVPYVGAGIGNPQLVMDEVGLTNIAADVDATWASLSWEAIIDADPDVIIVIDSSWGPADWKIDTFEDDPAVSSLTAVREGRYIIVPFPAGEAGVRSVEAVETIAAQLKDLDLP